MMNGVGRRNEGQNQNKCLAAKIQEGIAQKPAPHTGLLGLGIIHKRAWSLSIRTATILVPKKYQNLDEPEDAIRYVPCLLPGVWSFHPRLPGCGVICDLSAPVRIP